MQGARGGDPASANKQPESDSIVPLTSIAGFSSTSASQDSESPLVHQPEAASDSAVTASGRLGLAPPHISSSAASTPDSKYPAPEDGSELVTEDTQALIARVQELLHLEGPGACADDSTSGDHARLVATLLRAVTFSASAPHARDITERCGLYPRLHLDEDASASAVVGLSNSCYVTCFILVVLQCWFVVPKLRDLIISSGRPESLALAHAAARLSPGCKELARNLALARVAHELRELFRLMVASGRLLKAVDPDRFLEAFAEALVHCPQIQDSKLWVQVRGNETSNVSALANKPSS